MTKKQGTKSVKSTKNTKGTKSATNKKSTTNTKSTTNKKNKKVENKVIKRTSRTKRPEQFKGTELEISPFGNDIPRKPIMIVDGVMGLGKTTAAINYINDQPLNAKVLFVTPFLEEIERIIVNCPDRNFKQPSNKKGTKKSNFKELLQAGENIACTHALFDNFDRECFDLSQAEGYILFVDEVSNNLEELEIKKEDLKLILGWNDEGEKVNKEVLAKVNEETKQLEWIKPDYEGKLEVYKHKCEMGSIFVYGEKRNEYLDNTFIWTFPIEIYKAFKQVFILTYLFEGQIQCGYLKLFNMDYKYIHVVSSPRKDQRGIKLGIKTDYNFDGKLYDTPQQFDLQKYKELIHISGYDSFNSREKREEGKMIGLNDTDLSVSWFKKNKKNLSYLQKGLKNFLINKNSEIPSRDKMWSTWTEFQKDLQYNGYKNEFVSFNCRATNNYRHKYILAYACNVYYNPIYVNFLSQRGIKIDVDKYALSEMLQWIFRSRIREGKEIWIYLPSYRMEMLLRDWMDGK